MAEGENTQRRGTDDEIQLIFSGGGGGSLSYSAEKGRGEKGEYGSMATYECDQW